MKPQILKIGEASQMIGVSLQTMRNMADNGDIPCVTLPSGHRRFRKEDVEKFLKKHGDD